MHLRIKIIMTIKQPSNSNKTPDFHRAYGKLITRVEKLQTDEQLLNSIEQFYIITELYGKPKFNDTLRELISGLDVDTKMQYLYKLCTEIINMDYVMFIQTGRNQKLANQYYRTINDIIRCTKK